MKLPLNAKLVFPGILFDVYQWDQEMYDGSTKAFEMLKRRSSVDIIVVDGDKILVTEEEQPSRKPFLSTVGGGMEEWENPLECAKRELLEEVGYEASEWIVFRNTFGSSSKLDYEETFFIARNIRKVSEPHLDGGERIAFRWVSFDKFIHMVRDSRFKVPLDFKFEMYEALLDSEKYESLRREILGK